MSNAENTLDAMNEAKKCPKCRTMEPDTCHSIHCPMRRPVAPEIVEKWKIEYSKYSTYCNIIDADGYVGTIQGREKAELIAKAPEMAAELEQLRSEREVLLKALEFGELELRTMYERHNGYLGSTALFVMQEALKLKSALQGE